MSENMFFSPEIISDIGALLLALILGGAVGIQRERSGHEAGFRTNTLVCIGSALAMIVSIRMHEVYGGDAGRIAAQVISGIGFLGAGTIIRTGLSVRGLTTAAGLWVMACIGLAAGAHLYVTATAGTIVCVLVLAVMGRLERRSGKKNRGNICTLSMKAHHHSGLMAEIFGVLEEIDTEARLEEVRISEENVMSLKILLRTGATDHHADTLQKLGQIQGVIKLAIMCEQGVTMK